MNIISRGPAMYGWNFVRFSEYQTKYYNNKYGKGKDKVVSVLN